MKQCNFVVSRQNKFVYIFESRHFQKLKQIGDVYSPKNGWPTCLRRYSKQLKVIIFIETFKFCTICDLFVNIIETKCKYIVHIKFQTSWLLAALKTLSKLSFFRQYSNWEKNNKWVMHVSCLKGFVFNNFFTFSST